MAKGKRNRNDRRAYGEMSTSGADLLRVEIGVFGEMAADDIPVGTHGMDIDAYLAGDTQPLHTVVSVPVSYSKRGWFYTAAALQKIVGEVNAKALPGFLGHQREEDIAHEFPKVATMWVGAKFDPAVGEHGTAYFRGIVDPSHADLKRLIRSRAIDTVSIFGRPGRATVNGEVHVVDYEPMSIDWTPRGRAGMQTKLEYVGEMDSFVHELPAGTKAETPGDPPRTQGVGNMETLAQILAKLRADNVRADQVIGEMHWSPADVAKALNVSLEDLAKAIDAQTWTSLSSAQSAIGEMAVVAGTPQATPAQVVEFVRAQAAFVGEMMVAIGAPDGAKREDVLALARSAAQAHSDLAKERRDKTIEKVIGEMVDVEALRPLVKDFLVVPEAATEEQVKAAVGEIMGRDSIKAARENLFGRSTFRSVGTQASGTQTNGTNGNTPAPGLTPRRVSY